jgi:hypothetical protein
VSIDRLVVARAEAVAEAALRDFLGLRGRNGGVVLSSVAGAGKSYFVGRAAGSARREGMRLAVCAPTNEQAFGLVDVIAQLNPTETVTFVPAAEVSLPASVAARPNVQSQKAVQACTADLIVGTFDKLGDAIRRGDLAPVDGLLADESYQADSGRYYGVAGMARAHLLVGDGGQIEPFSTTTAGKQWRGLAEDPLQTAVDVLQRNHPRTPLHLFPITRRLDGRAMPVVKTFYPEGFSFAPAVLPGIRELRIARSAAGDRRTRALDRALELAAADGWAHLELPAQPALAADPVTTAVIVELIARLLVRRPQVRCERETKLKPLRPERIAIGVSHNDQKDQLRAGLDAAGLGAVVVNTANKLQGLEFDVVVAWHPLAGLSDTDEFHLEAGRMCVLLTRHRHACIVVGRAGDRQLVEGIPPASPAFLGRADEPVLDGWRVHEGVFRALAPFRLMI